MERFAPGHHLSYQRVPSAPRAVAPEPDEEEEESEVIITVNMTRTMTYSYQMSQSEAADFFGCDDTPHAVRQTAEGTGYLTWEQEQAVVDHGEHNDTDDTLDEIYVESAD